MVFYQWTYHFQYQQTLIYYFYLTFIPMSFHNLSIYYIILLWAKSLSFRFDMKWLTLGPLFRIIFFVRSIMCITKSNLDALLYNIVQYPVIIIFFIVEAWQWFIHPFLWTEKKKKKNYTHTSQCNNDTSLLSNAISFLISEQIFQSWKISKAFKAFPCILFEFLQYVCMLP